MRSISANRADTREYSTSFDQTGFLKTSLENSNSQILTKIESLEKYFKQVIQDKVILVIV